MNMNKDKEIQIAQIKGKTAITTAIIGSIGVIVAAIIGIFSINVNIENNKLKENYETLKSEKTELVAQTNQSEEEYNNLKSMYSDLEKENSDLKNRVNVLESESSQYNSLVEENNLLNNEVSKYSSLEIDYNNLKAENDSLKEEIEQLNNELQAIKDNSTYKMESNISDSFSVDSRKRVSIFDLPTSKGDGKWRVPSSDSLSTSSNNIFYSGARYASHYATTKNDIDYICTYSLGNKYSECEGEIVWSDYSKNMDGNAWIEFYSDDELIFKTDAIRSDSEPLPFSFSVKNIDKLTIVRNSTTSHTSYYTAYIIYPYLNLVE